MKLSCSRRIVMSPSRKLLYSTFGIVIIFSIFLYSRVNAQILDVPYISTPSEVVDKMLEVADVGLGDYVIDLGCGDGRIVIAAADKGAQGHGVDLNPERIKEAEENARKAGVSDRVMFVEEDIFDTDFSRANVITMYLLGSVNKKLRPHLLDKLEPGTKVVSHAFNMGDWKPDKQVQIDHVDIYSWIIPAKVEGIWGWQVNGKIFTMSVEQNFQEIQPKIKSGDLSFNIKDKVLVGKRISFTAVNPDNGHKYVYNGRVDKNRIKGKVQIHGQNYKSIENWSANLNFNLTCK